jgi:hypothetical protein
VPAADNDGIKVCGHGPSLPDTGRSRADRPLSGKRMFSKVRTSATVWLHLRVVRGRSIGIRLNKLTPDAILATEGGFLSGKSCSNR